MIIETHTLDSLRNLVRNLQAENKELRKLLDKAGIPCADSEVFSDVPDKAEEYDPDQGARINRQYIDRDMAVRFFAMFWGREDVFARRGKNGGYYPQCKNRWSSVCPKQRGEKQYCEDCSCRDWIKLTPEILMKHLFGYREDGADVIGIYPLLPDGTCRFLVFDFDNHEKGAEKQDFANADETWYEEVDALRKICAENGIDALVERSRSGKGAHVWIFFRRPIPASTARNFGFLLLDKGAAAINLKSFRYYDRMYPSQDVANSIGNLVALPLQGQALKNGNSAFVDENWNAYPEQWRRLFQTKRLSQEIVYDYIDSHVRVFNNMYLKRLRTYKKLGFRVTGSADGVKQEANAIYDPDHYTAVFERDLIEAEKEIVISSPQMTRKKVDRLIYLIKARQETGVRITVITENPENVLYGNPAFAYTLIWQMQCAGIKVEVVEEGAGRFAVIDRLLVWYGSVDFLGKEDARDCLIRVKDERAASELLEIL